MKNLKYIAVGITVGYLGLYVFEHLNAKLPSFTTGENKEKNN